MSTSRPRKLSDLPEPAWPAVLLAGIQVADGLACVGPIPAIARCFEDVNFPQRLWPLVPVIKTAAAAGLLLGTRVRGLGALTNLCLVAYFIVAISAHLRARDFSRNLFVNATGMFTICVTVLWVCFVRRPGQPGDQAG